MTTKAIVVHPVLPDAENGRAPANRLAEAVGLARALALDIVSAELSTVNSPRPATLYGTGKVEEIGARIAAAEVELVIVDAKLSPVQQRNLEKAWKAKVVDRTGLILEIFGDRAQTKEGVLQVELAHLEYQRGRLVRSWTHLERQRGGAGFMGGPGETQIEADRRQIADRILTLKKRLEKVARTRGLHRASRQKAPYPTVALVGYTNAGKSTLFNRLTRAGVLAEDMLFATLDPTMRAVRTPRGRRIVLSDTVGFISNLPTELVAAFRATLEEVLAADVIVHVRDAVCEDSAEQRDDVLGVLGDLGLEAGDIARVIEARNKIDLLAPEDRLAAENEAARSESAVCVSAESGEGVDALMALIEARLSEAADVFEARLPASAGAAIAWLYEQGCVLETRPNAEADPSVHLLVAADADDRGRFEKRFGFALAPVDAPRPN